MGVTHLSIKNATTRWAQGDPKGTAETCGAIGERA